MEARREAEDAKSMTLAYAAQTEERKVIQMPYSSQADVPKSLPLSYSGQTQYQAEPQGSSLQSQSLGTRITLPNETVDYGLAHMYSMSSILSAGSHTRGVEAHHKRELYGSGVPRTQASDFVYAADEGRLPGISYMMSQESSVRHTGLDMTLTSAAASQQSQHQGAPPSSIATPLVPPSTLDSATPLLGNQVLAASATSTRMFTPRAYDISNDSDDDSDLDDTPTTHMSAAHHQGSRYVSPTGRIDIKKILDATKMSPDEEHFGHSSQMPFDIKEHVTVLPLRKDFDRHAMLTREIESHPQTSSPSIMHQTPESITVAMHHHHQDMHESQPIPTMSNSDSSFQTDSPPSSPEKQKRSFDNRSIQSYWFHEFPWLLLDTTQNLFYCRYCMETSNVSVFAKGRPTIKPKKDYFVKHEQTEVHREAERNLRRMLGLDPTQDLPPSMPAMTAPLEPSTSQQWSSAPIMKRELPPEITSGTSLLPLRPINPAIDEFQRPLIIDSTNAHILTLVASPKSGPENRALHERWFEEFPWLIYDFLKDKFICKVCMDAGTQTVFATGKSGENPKKTNFVAHEKSLVHLEALRALGRDPSSPEAPLAGAVSAHVLRGDSEEEEDDDTARDLDEDGHMDGGSTRRIRPQWFMEFPWLELNQHDQCFYCKLCRLYKQPGVFSFGKSAINPKKDSFVKHENTEGHKIAALQDTGMSGEDAARTVLSMQEALNTTLARGPENQHQHDALQQYSTNHRPGEGPAQPETPEGGLPPPEKPGTPEPDPNRLLAFCGNRGPHNRRIKLEWFMEFPWLELDEKKDVFYCKLCRIYHPIGIFVSGKNTANPKRDDLKKHEETEGHKIALAAHTRAGSDGEARLEQHSLDPSNAHIIDITTVFQITQGQGLPMPGASGTSEGDASGNKPQAEDLSKLFSWYKIDQTNQTAYCDACKEAGLTNPFGLGAPMYVVMKMDCAVHEKIAEHIEAVKKQRPVSPKKETEAEPEPARTNNAPESGRRMVVPQIQSLPLPDDALADSKSTWRSTFWQFANQMRHLGILCDITLSVGSGPSGEYKYYHAHKLMLVCASELFKTYLRDDDLQAHYHFDNISPAGLEGILEFVYGQPIKDMSREQSAECYTAANVLIMPKARKLFEKSTYTPPPKKGRSRRKRSTPKKTAAGAVPVKKPCLNPANSEEDNDTIENDDTDELNETTDVEPEQEIKSEPSAKAVEEEKPAEDAVEVPARKRTEGQLSKKPSIMGRLRPKEKARAYAGLRAIQAKARRSARIKKEVTPEPSTSTAASSKTTKTEKKTDPDAGSSQESASQGASKVKHHIRDSEYAAERKRLLGDSLPTCDICGKKFLRQAFLVRHKELKHFNGTTTKDHKCDTCDKIFSSRYDLKIHQRRHTGERPYLCNVCGKSFTRRETLIEHSYIHKPDEEKPHRCENCGKGFYKIYDLQRHFVGIHSGARPFQCHLCGKSFPWARSLSDHLQSHQGADRIRPFKCDECDMTFRRKYDLERHKVKHAAQKPFVCEWCGHGFTQKGSMDKHKREFCHGRPGASVPTTRQSRSTESRSQTGQGSNEDQSLEGGMGQGPVAGTSGVMPVGVSHGSQEVAQDGFPGYAPPVQPGHNLDSSLIYYSHLAHSSL